MSKFYKNYYFIWGVVFVAIDFLVSLFFNQLWILAFLLKYPFGYIPLPEAVLGSTLGFFLVNYPIIFLDGMLWGFVIRKLKNRKNGKTQSLSFAIGLWLLFIAVSLYIAGLMAGVYKGFSGAVVAYIGGFAVIGLLFLAVGAVKLFKSRKQS